MSGQEIREYFERFYSIMEGTEAYHDEGMELGGRSRRDGDNRYRSESWIFYMRIDLSFIGRESPRPRFRAVLPGSVTARTRSHRLDRLNGN